MTTLDADNVTATLETVRAELLRQATEDGERLIARGRDEATCIVEQGRDEARQLTEDARAAGRVAGAAAAAEQATALRRELRREVFAAKDHAYQLWRQRAREAVLQLCDDSDYPRWRQGLRSAASAVLGDDAVVSEHPSGGFVAQLGHRRADLSLAAVADRALDQIAADIEELWS